MERTRLVVVLVEKNVITSFLAIPLRALGVMVPAIGLTSTLCHYMDTVNVRHRSAVEGEFCEERTLEAVTP